MVKKALNMASLPKHQMLFEQILSYFKGKAEVSGIFLSGSGAVGNMDRYSDLDLGFVCSSSAAREKIWNKRFEWDLPMWFHRMDADHVKPHFIIYLFEPDIHVDLAFYTLEALLQSAGAPYYIVWDSTGSLEKWAQDMNSFPGAAPDWENVIHEDEQFWTWIHYSWCHVARGEYYDIASQFEFLRRIPHTWYARLKGKPVFDSRRLEQKGDAEFIQTMSRTYASPDLLTLKNALLALIEIHNYQRSQLDKILTPYWKTSSAARIRITQLVQNL